MHFIVGHPRSGTQLLTDLLNAGATKVAAHEALVEQSPGSSLIALATDYYEGRIDAGTVKEVLAGFPVPAAVGIDVSWKNTWILPVLLELYPEARVLHLARDPRHNVIACHNLGYYGQIEFHPEYPIYHRWLQGMPSIRRPDWEFLSPFERNCAFWVESHRLVFEMRASLGERYGMTRIEDIHDPAVVADLFEFFQRELPQAESIQRVLAGSSNPQARIKGYVETAAGEILLPEFEQCPPQVQESLLSICAPMADQLGYRLR